MFLTQPANITLKQNDTYQVFIMVHDMNCGTTLWMMIGNCTLDTTGSNCSIDHDQYDTKRIYRLASHTILFNITFNQTNLDGLNLISSSGIINTTVSFYMHDMTIIAPPTAHLTILTATTISTTEPSTTQPTIEPTKATAPTIPCDLNSTNSSSLLSYPSGLHIYILIFVIASVFITY